MSPSNETAPGARLDVHAAAAALLDVGCALVVVAGGLGLGVLSMRAGHEIAWMAGLAVGVTWGVLLLAARTRATVTSSAVLRSGAATVLLVGTGLVLVWAVWTAFFDQAAPG